MPTHIKKPGSGYALDLTGHTFHFLTVTGKVKRGKKIYWTCVCTCGETKPVRADCLTKGTTKSCGCQMGRLISLAQTGVPSTARQVAAQKRVDRYYQQFPERKKGIKIQASRTVARHSGKVHEMPTEDQQAMTRLKMILDARKSLTNWCDTAELAGCTVDEAKGIHEAFYAEEAA